MNVNPKVDSLIERLARFTESSYAQIGLAVLLVLAGYTLLFTYFFSTYTRQNTDQRKGELQRLVEVGLSTIEPVREQQRNGKLTPEQARNVGLDLIQRMSFSDGQGSNYLFMGSYSGLALTPPTIAPREGTQFDQVDANGVNIVAELIKAAQGPGGAGYVTYLYPPPGSTQPQTKMSYVVGIPEWNSYIGTGMYLGDIEAENQTYLRNSLLLMSGLFVFVFFVIYVALRPTLISYRTLLHLFYQVISDPDSTPDVPVQQFRSGSEGWQLISGFQNMLERLRQSKQQLRDSEERINLAIAGATDGLWDWDIRTNTVYFSPRWKGMLGYADDELPNKFEAWQSRIHPDDVEKVNAALNDHLCGQTPVYEVEHRLHHKDGAYRWILARGASVHDAAGKPYRMAGSHTDITRRKRTEEALRRRDAILEAVSFAAEYFLCVSTSWETNIAAVLERLGQATGVYRVYIFENHTDPDGELYMHETHFWAAPGTVPLPPNIDVTHFRYRDLGFGRWIDVLGSGQIIHGQLADMPASEQTLLKEVNILSLVIVPIFVGEQWWGQIGFDEREMPREWSLSEIDALKTAANTLGAVIQQNQSDRAIREREEQYRSIFENTTDGLIIADLNGKMVEANPACCSIHGYTHDEFLRLGAHEYMAPESWQQVDDFIESMLAGGEPKAQMVAMRKDGTRFDAEVRGARIIYQGQPHLLGVMRDITERVQAYRILEQRVQERTRELTALLEVSHNVGATLELQPLLNMILDQLKTLVDYSGAAIFFEQGGKMVVVDYRGPVPAEVVMNVDIPKWAGVDDVMAGRQPIIIDDVRADTPLGRAFVSAAGPYMDTTFNYIRSWMGVPLMTKEWVIGVLTLDYERPGYYTPQHASLAMAIANQAAIAIENARLYEQAQQLAVLEERQRLARELHDSVSQALYGIALGARTARTWLDRDPTKVAEPLNYVLSLAEAGLAEMRALIFELRPESLETEGLVAALTKQAASVKARHNLSVDTEFCVEPPLPFEIKEAFYRIGQEALNNTVKHARASRVELKLLCSGDGRLTLLVRDNGAGFDPNGQFPGHLGLKSMRERIARFGGTLEITSAPGKGACVLAQVKIQTP